MRARRRADLADEGGRPQRALMALSSPDGDALLEAPSSPVSAWLERTLRVVPPGTEHEQLGMDDGAEPRCSPPPPGDDLWTARTRSAGRRGPRTTPRTGRGPGTAYERDRGSEQLARVEQPERVERRP